MSTPPMFLLMFWTIGSRNVFDPAHPGTRVYGRGDAYLRWEDQEWIAKPRVWWNGIPPRKLTWNLKITPLERKIIFKPYIFRFHVSFRGCNLLGKPNMDLWISWSSCDTGQFFMWHTFDGKNPAPVKIQHLGKNGINCQPQLVQDFFHQQYY